MKTITIALILLLQQTPDAFRTAGAINGRAWAALGDREKSVYMLGLFEGTIALHLELGQEPSLAAAQQTITAARKRLEASNVTEVGKSIDTFYTDTNNTRIPVIFAFQYALKRIGGASAKDLEDYLASLKKRFPEPDAIPR